MRVAALYDIHGNVDALEAVLAEIETAGPDVIVVVCGHTHHQFDRRVLGKRVLDAGSVGRPDEDEPAAYWLWLGPDAQLRRTYYDVAAAAGRMRASGLPGVDELMLRESLLEPVGAAFAARRWEERAQAPE